MRKPLDYVVARQNGSHRTMKSPNYPTLGFSWHDRATIPRGLVRKVLVEDVGLTEADAHRAIDGKLR
ncbi:MAG: type II toxin-antitoxin system HicA family toxin [Acidimicrobiia bacterium]